MQREQWQMIAVGAGFLAVIAAIATGRMPRWLRVVLVLGIVMLLSGVGLYVYRTVSHPKTLTVAAGSFDGDAPQLMAALASRMAATNAPIRLNVTTVPSPADAAKALSTGAADLAVV